MVAKGVKQFIEASDRSFEYVSTLIDDAVKTGMTIEQARDLMELIKCTAQSVKMLREDEPHHAPQGIKKKNGNIQVVI